MITFNQVRVWSMLVLTGLSVSSCDDKTKKEEDKSSVETVLPTDPNKVTTMILESTDFMHELVSNGKLSASQIVDLRFTSPEIISRIYVKNGDRVRKGDKIAELDKFKLQHKLNQSKDDLMRSKLELQDVLIGQGYSLEDSLAIPADIMKLAKVKSGYDKAVSQLDLAQYEMNNAVLTAPFDGTVANLFTKQLSTPSTTDPFCSVIGNSGLGVEFSVLESELPLIQRGNRVEVRPYAYQDKVISGQVTEVNPIVDANGMVKVVASVPASADLFEGMNVRVNVQRSLGKQLVVPKEAVVLRTGRKVVFTLKDDLAMWVYVDTGLENSTSYTITDGLVPGDTVIVSGNINLAHEAPVTVVDQL